jgi:hypothetical protein
VSARVPALVALAAGIAVAAWLLWGANPPGPRGTAIEDGAGAARAPPGLAGSPARGSAGDAPAADDAAEFGPAPVARSGAPVPSESAREGVEMRIRLSRVLTEDRREDVPISEILRPGPRPLAGPLRVFPGDRLEIRSSDPRVAFPRVRMQVPHPIPEEFVLALPSIDDPAIQTVVVEVVDSETKAPLSDATYTFEDDDLAPLRADSQGHIRFGPGNDRRGRPGSGLFLWLAEPGTLHAPGHLSFAPRSGVWDLQPGSMPALRLSDLDAWRERPVARVELRPLPPSVDQRRIRLLHADGKPAEGTLVVVRVPFPAGFGLAGGEATDGVRRVGPTGEVQTPMQKAIGLDLRKDGLPLLSLQLHADRWPESGAREVRLPPIADVVAVIDDAPDVTGGRWEDADDPLGAARTPTDGPIHPVLGDSEVTAYLASSELALAIGVARAAGSLTPKSATLRLSFPVGDKRRLRLTYGEETRLLSLSPSKPGPLSVHARWADLPAE